MTNEQAALIAAVNLMAANESVQDRSTEDIKNVTRVFLDFLNGLNEETARRKLSTIPAAKNTQPEPPAFAVGARVRILINDDLVKEGDEGEIKGKSYVGGKIVWDVKVDGLAGMCEFEEHELEPLGEPAALPEGVTRKGNAYVIPDDETEHGYMVEGDTTHKLVTLQYTDQYIVFTKAEFEKFLIVGALLMNESEMYNGR